MSDTSEFKIIKDRYIAKIPGENTAIEFTVSAVNPSFPSFWAYLKHSFKTELSWKFIIGMILCSIASSFTKPGRFVPEAIEWPYLLASCAWSACAIGWAIVEFKKIFK